MGDVALRPRTRRVRVQFRVFGALAAGARSSFVVSENGMPIWWCFYFLLERFLRRAPGPEISIGRLVLDFVTSGPPAALAAADALIPWRISQLDTGLHAELRDKLMRPEWLARFAHVHVHRLLDMNHHTAAYRALLHERLGVLEIFIDGVPYKTADVGQILARLSYSDPRHTFGHVAREDRIAAFWSWKEATIRKRQALDLSSGA